MRPSRLLVILAVSFSACAADPPGMVPEADPEDEADVSDPDDTDVARAVVDDRVVLDLIAATPSAAWQTTTTPIAFDSDSADGAVRFEHGIVEGAPPPTIWSRPPATGGQINGGYQVTIPAAFRAPRLVSTFGFVKGSSAGDGVTFRFVAFVDGQWVTLGEKHKREDGLAREARDRSPYAGKTMSLFLVADGGATGGATKRPKSRAHA